MIDQHDAEDRLDYYGVPTLIKDLDGTVSYVSCGSHYSFASIDLI